MSEPANSPLLRRGYVIPSHFQKSEAMAVVSGSAVASYDSLPVAVIDLSRREELRDKVAAAITLAQRGDSAHEIADAIVAALLGEGK